MTLKTLRVKGFRNLDPASVRLDRDVNLLHGPNAQGKTNFLEAVYFLGTTRSFREKRINALVTEGREETLVEGEVEEDGVHHRLSVQLDSKGKRYWRDGKGVSLPEYLASLPVVSLSAEDRDLVKGGPAYRRGFLDATSLWRKRGYVHTLLEFGRNLRQRNELLRRGRPAGAELEAWTRAFLDKAETIRRERRAVVRGINETLAGLRRDLGMDERVTLAYRPNGGKDLARTLARLVEEEGRLGFTLAGPHRDGVDILLNGRSLKEVGSSGQVRTAVWMVKLTSVLLLVEEGHRLPVFLLDDVEAELDEKRVRGMMDLTVGRAQLIMTANRFLDGIQGPVREIRVENGRFFCHG